MKDDKVTRYFNENVIEGSRKKGQKESKWNYIDRCILDAFKKIETESEYPFEPVTVKKLFNELKQLEKPIVRRTIYNHLNGFKPPQVNKRKSGLIDRGLIVKLNRGQYSRKITIIAKSIVQEFIVSEVHNEAASFDHRLFDERLEFEYPEYQILSQKEESLRKKNAFLQLLYFWKWNRALNKKSKSRYKFREPSLRKLQFIENKSKVDVFSKSYINLIQKRAIQHKSMELILAILDERFEELIDDVSFNIIISYNPLSGKKLIIEPNKIQEKQNDFGMNTDWIDEAIDIARQFDYEKEKIEQRKSEESFRSR